MFAVIIVLVIILAYYLYRSNSLGTAQTVILFYRDGCPWCEIIKPEWKVVENNLGIRAKKINTADPKQAEIVKLYKVVSVPTIILLDKEGKSETYDGERDAGSMVPYFMRRMKY
jgi:thioredoxin-related protein